MGTNRVQKAIKKASRFMAITHVVIEVVSIYIRTAFQYKSIVSFKKGVN